MLNRILTLLFAAGLSFAGQAQSTVITYQGQLRVAGTPYTGSAEFQFTVWDAASGGAQLAATTPAITATSVTDGLFTANLDFGASAFTGADRWLDVQVRTGGGAFTPLTTRQQLTATPYALRAREAGGVPNATITGPMLAPGAVGTSALGDVSVTTAKIADGTITGADVNAASFGTTFWRATGNAGTTAGTHFIGTTDFRPLEFRAAGSRALQLDVNGNLVGGFYNFVSNSVVNSVIGGGGASFGFPSIAYPNVISGAGYSFIGGGYGNRIGTNYASVVAGGAVNTNLAYAAFIGGGEQNSLDAAADYSTIGGGAGNAIAGRFALIPGGSGNSANGNYSFAAGRGAAADHQGAFVWADSQGGGFASTRDNQFRVRARGGLEVVGGPFVEAFKFSGTRAGDFGSPVAYGVNQNTSGNSGPALRLVNEGGNAVHGVLSVSSLGIGNLASFGNSSAFVAWLTTNGTWNALAYNGTSDRNAKENFSPVDSRSVLDKVVALPLARWNYKEAPGLDHIGPVAQDFHASFGLNGDDDKHIATVDADGVALAAIQGLNEKLEERSQTLELRSQSLEAGLKQKMTEIEELKRQNGELLRRLDAIEQRLQ